MPNVADLKSSISWTGPLHLRLAESHAGALLRSTPGRDGLQIFRNYNQPAKPRTAINSLLEGKLEQVCRGAMGFSHDTETGEPRKIACIEVSRREVPESGTARPKTRRPAAGSPHLAHSARQRGWRSGLSLLRGGPEFRALATRRDSEYAFQSGSGRSPILPCLARLGSFCRSRAGVCFDLTHPRAGKIARIVRSPIMLTNPGAATSAIEHLRQVAVKFEHGDWSRHRSRTRPQ